MSLPWEIRVYENRRKVHTTEVDGPAALGRQANDEEGLYAEQWQGDTRRLVIAPGDERGISRQHVRLEPLPEGRLRCINESKNFKVRFADGRELEPMGSCELPLPLKFFLGKKEIRVQEKGKDSLQLQCLEQATLPPGSAAPLASLSLPAGGIDAETFTWLQAAMDVVQSAADSLDFFPRAARALVDLVQLDSGRVLLLEKDAWKVQSVYLAPHQTASPGWQPSRQVLNSLLTKKKTFWQMPAPTQLLDSLHDIDAVVAAPILGRQGEVLGALYGDRWQYNDPSPTQAISELEAMRVALLACGVAAGLPAEDLCPGGVSQPGSRAGGNDLLLLRYNPKECQRIRERMAAGQFVSHEDVKKRLGA